MLKAACIALLLAAVVGMQVGRDVCTRGPGYWCATVNNAKECNTERHCREKVWIGKHPLAKLTKPIPEDKKTSGGNCAICELIGNKVVEKMTDNATETEAVKEMEGMCKVFPASEKSKCVRFMDKYAKDFYELLVNDVNVHDICTYVGMCTEKFLTIMREGKVLGTMMKNKYKDIGCDTCEAGIALIQKESKDHQKDIEALLDKLCGMLPVDEAECDSIINTIFEEGIDYFDSLTPKEACQLLGMCSSGLYNIGILPVEQVQKPVMLGKSHHCQNGPAYWCSTPNTMKECNAEEFCKKQKKTINF